MAGQIFPLYATSYDYGNVGVALSRSTIVNTIKGSVAAADKIRKPFRVLNKNLSSLKDPGNLVRAVEELQKTIQDIREQSIRPSQTNTNNTPVHGSASYLLGGQYLEVVSQGSGVPIILHHGLNKIPSGMINVYDTTFLMKLALDGDANYGAPAATNTLVSIIPFVDDGARTFIVLF